MQLRPITHFILFALALTVCLVCARVISSSANTGQKTQPTPLQGEAALTHLKQQGQYDSLQEAMQQARYTVQRANTTPLGRPAWHAPNSAAGYDGYVTEDGVSIALKDQSYVSLTLRGIGYGYSLQYVGGGEVSGDKQSLTIKRDGQWSGLKEWYVNGEGGLEQGIHLDQVADQVAVGQLRALGDSRRARGVQDHRGVLRRPRRLRRSIGTYQPQRTPLITSPDGDPGINSASILGTRVAISISCPADSGLHGVGDLPVVGKDHARPRVLEEVRDLALLAHWVDRHDDEIGQLRSVERDREGGDVRQHECHPVPGPQSSSTKICRHGDRCLAQLRERQLDVVEAQGDPLPVTPSGVDDLLLTHNIDEAVLAAGAQRAREVSAKTLNRVYERIGFLPQLS